MKRTLAVLGVILALAITGCGRDVVQGRVTGKFYSPESLVSYPICAGNPMICTPQFIFTPEQYSLGLFDGQDDGYEAVRVDQWQECNIGNNFNGSSC